MKGRKLPQFGKITDGGELSIHVPSECRRQPMVWLETTVEIIQSHCSRFYFFLPLQPTKDLIATNTI